MDGVGNGGSSSSSGVVGSAIVVLFDKHPQGGQMGLPGGGRGAHVTEGLGQWATVVDGPVGTGRSYVVLVGGAHEEEGLGQWAIVVDRSGGGGYNVVPVGVGGVAVEQSQGVVGGQ